MTSNKYVSIDNPTDDQRCAARLNISGEGFRCDLRKNHQGWAHSSAAAQALWTGSHVTNNHSLPDGGSA